MLWKQRNRDRPVLSVREWLGANGEEFCALHPFYAVLCEQPGVAEKQGREGLAALRRFEQEIKHGERRFTDAMAERMLEIDAEQRAAGAPDETIDNLAALLQGRPQRVTSAGPTR